MISLKMFIFWTYAFEKMPFLTNFPKDMSISQKLFHLSKIGSDIILVEVLGLHWDKQNVNIFDGVFWEFFWNFIQFRQKTSIKVKIQLFLRNKSFFRLSRWLCIRIHDKNYCKHSNAKVRSLVLTPTLRNFKIRIRRHWQRSVRLF